MKKVPYKVYMAKGVELYGEDKTKWKFRCVSCGHVQTQQDFTDAGIADADMLAHFSCIGRFVKDVGCDWTLGGLLQIHKLEVLIRGIKNTLVFEFPDYGFNEYEDKEP